MFISKPAATHFIALSSLALLMLGAPDLSADRHERGSASGPVCDAREDYRERMHFKVSYLRISIGTFELYFSESCGMNVMETFPNVGFLRVYTEYFATFDDEGYLLEAELWDEDGDEWEFQRLSRLSGGPAYRYIEGVADSQFGETISRERARYAYEGVSAYETMSLISAARTRLGSEDSLSLPVFHEGEIVDLPITVVSRGGQRTVDAFPEPVETASTEFELDFEGVHGLRGALRVEFSNDARAIPLYVEARIFLGRIRLELTEYEIR